MERRLLLFFVLSFLILQVTMWWAAPPPKKPAEVAAKGELADDEKGAEAGAGPADDGAADADEPAEAAGEDAAADGAADEPEAEQPLEYVTLGSVDPDSGYRMLVTFTNEGAAVRRLELSSARYLDIHDRGGYLGHLELANDGAAGLVIRTVGPGTPAEEAGLRVGDRLLEAGGAKVAKPADLAPMLAAREPKDELALKIERDGQPVTLTAKLRRRPLDVIRPESENVLLRTGKLPEGFIEPPSFLLTLDEVDKGKIPKDAQELPGVDLRQGHWEILDRAAESVTFRRRVPRYNLTVTKRYRLAKTSAEQARDRNARAYHLELDVTFSHAGEAGSAARQLAYRLDGPNGLPIEGWWYAIKTGREWSSPGIRDVIGRYVGQPAPTQQSPPAIISGEALDFEGAAPLAYMGVDAQYFCSALIPLTKNPDESWITLARSVLLGPKPDSRTGDAKYANVTCRLISRPLQLEPGAEVTHSYEIFAGPKRPELLSQYRYPPKAKIAEYSLSEYVYYGWFGPVAQGMVGLLHIFYEFVGNYGVAIVMLTVLVRGCMFPVSRGQAKSMAKLQELRPEMERIKERYKGDQQKQAHAMQQLYRKHNVNPLAGCLPMLIQLPVFIGLYRGLAVDVELRGAPLISQSVRWCSNLAAPDMLWDWSGVMPAFVNRGEGIFGLGPYLNVLPLVTIVLFLVQQKMFMPEPANEQAAMQQKIMKYMMVFMGLLFYKVPSGLCIYFIASSLWGIAERKLVPPPSANVPSSAGDSAVVRTNKSAAAPDKSRSSKNGNPWNKPGGKAKRRR